MPTLAPTLSAPPTQCALCRGWQRGDAGGLAWCGDCDARFAPERPRCRRCALPLGVPAERCGHCLAEAPAFEAAVAAVDYGFPWDGLLAAFKFQGQVELADALAARLAQVVSAAHSTEHSAGRPLPELVLPVPLAAGRLAQRGFNQAWELARRVAAALALPADATLLERIADTPHQTGLDRRARQANLAQAFMVDPTCRTRLAGRRVALVDDVLTTGATLDAAAAELLRAGAQSVQAWVFARTPAPGDKG